MGSTKAIREDARAGRGKRHLLMGVASVVLLALVMFGVSALTQPSRDDDVTSPDLALSEDQGQELFDSAMEALDLGDVPGAIGLLQRALVVDPSNMPARRELERLIAADGRTSPNNSGGTSIDVTEPSPTGTSPTPGGGTSSPDDPPTQGGGAPPPSDRDAGFLDPVDDLRDLLPSSVPGYELGLPVLLGDDVSVTGDPVESGPQGRVTRALFAVHDRGSPEAADAFIRDVMKVAFPSDSMNVEIGGVPAYFGTDGTRFAAIAYKRGRYVFEVVVTSSGARPASLKDDVIDAARAFPGAVP